MIKISKKYNNFIDYRGLIMMYHRFKNNPYKVFVKSDFTIINSKGAVTHLFVLEKLGLIEIVPAIYYSGRTRRIRREIKGYKLI